MFLIIGKNGFISKNLQSFKFNKKTVFTSMKDINKYNNVEKILLLSFDRKWFQKKNYDFQNEKIILDHFGDNVLIQYFSTSKVYENRFNLKETDKIMPQSIYAENKVLAEEFIKKNFLNYQIFRLTNIFSKKGGSKYSFFDIFLNNVKKNIFKFDISLSSQKDFVSIDFIYNALNTNNNINGIYNISSNIPISVKEICNIFENKSERVMEYILENNEIIRSQTLSNDKLLKWFDLKSLDKSQILEKISEIYV